MNDNNYNKTIIIISFMGKKIRCLAFISCFNPLYRQIKLPLSESLV